LGVEEQGVEYGAHDSCTGRGRVVECLLQINRCI
jgi:hypothetical protein